MPRSALGGLAPGAAPPAPAPTLCPACRAPPGRRLRTLAPQPPRAHAGVPAGNNPIVLVGTKVDLLPPGIDPAEVAEWLKAAAAFKRISAVSVHLVGWVWHRPACSTGLLCARYCSRLLRRPASSALLKGKRARGVAQRGRLRCLLLLHGSPPSR